MSPTDVFHPVRYKNTTGILVVADHDLTFQSTRDDLKEAWTWDLLGNAAANKEGSKVARLRLRLLSKDEEEGQYLIFSFKTREDLIHAKNDICLRMGNIGHHGGESGVRRELLDHSELWDDSMLNRRVSIPDWEDASTTIYPLAVPAISRKNDDELALDNKPKKTITTTTTIPATPITEEEEEKIHATFDSRDIDEDDTGMLGIRIQKLISSQHMVITEILEGTPAATSGLTTGMLLESINGRKVCGASIEHVEAMLENAAAAASAAAGKQVNVVAIKQRYRGRVVKAKLHSTLGLDIGLTTTEGGAMIEIKNIIQKGGGSRRAATTAQRTSPLKTGMIILSINGINCTGVATTARLDWLKEMLKNSIGPILIFAQETTTTTKTTRRVDGETTTTQVNNNNECDTPTTSPTTMVPPPPLLLVPPTPALLSPAPPPLLTPFAFPSAPFENKATRTESRSRATTTTNSSSSSAACWSLIFGMIGVFLFPIIYGSFAKLQKSDDETKNPESIEMEIIGLLIFTIIFGPLAIFQGISAIKEIKRRRNLPAGGRMWGGGCFEIAASIGIILGFIDIIGFFIVLFELK